MCNIKITKDEFISKYHVQKVLRFEPPTWEEFLATRTESICAHWFVNNSDISIIMRQENNKKGIDHSSNTFEIFNDNTWEHIVYHYGYGFDDREEMYYKALDIAKKWFLGD